MSTLKFGYFCGIEAEQFTFYRVPRLLIKDESFKCLSSDAKLLYGLMLDRMSLSMKNGWIDDENRVYVIYTIENIQEDLGCSKEKAVKTLAELDSKKGIGLVEKIRRGLGKPDIIYVKNFASAESENIEKEGCNADVSTEVGKTDFKKSEKPTSIGQENRLQEVGKTDFNRSEEPTSGGRRNRLQEVGKTDPNYNYINNTDYSYINHINQPMDGIDGNITDQDVCVDLIRKNIEYDRYMAEHDAYGQKIYEELFQLICETVCMQKQTVRIGGVDYPHEFVRSRFLSLTRSHLEYVMECLENTTTRITNIKMYLLAALYNAPSTMSIYIQQKVAHDMYGGGWEEKGIL